MCVLRLPACVHVCLHCLQLNGFSPVWAGICIFRSAEELNEWAHILQPWDFSPSAIGVVSETDDIVKKSILSWAETSGRRCQPMLSKKILRCLLTQLSLVCNKVQGRLQENLKYNMVAYPYKKSESDIKVTTFLCVVTPAKLPNQYIWKWMHFKLSVYKLTCDCSSYCSAMVSKWLTLQCGA